MSWTPGAPFVVPMRFASPADFIAGRTTADVAQQMMALDGADLPSDLRRAIVAELEARRARKLAQRAGVTA